MAFSDESSETVKQGYMYIKRERSTSAVTSRMLFKPWHKGYFVLCHNPFILEEYKDSSLKNQRQLHFIGTIKHVGAIITSKSQQFAFEVVMKEKTPLVLACDNQILLQEWLVSFKHIMSVLKNKQSRENLSSLVYTHSTRMSSLADSFEIEIVSTKLSDANDLHGDYIMALTPHRISLCNTQTFTEVLSWPMGCMSFQTSQPKLRRLILVMGKSCHFGFGKLIFETSDHEEMLEFIKGHYYIAATERSSFYKNRARQSMSLASSSSGSECSKTSLSNSAGVQGLSPTPEDEKVFNTDKADYFNEHDYNEIPQKIIFPPIKIELGYEQPIDSEITLGNSQKCGSFAEITAEESYILPNEPHVEPQMENHEKKIAIERKENLLMDDINDNDDALSYLQLVEEGEENAEADLKEEIVKVGVDPVEQLLYSITSTLQNPIKHQGQSLKKCIEYIDNVKKSKSESAIEKPSAKNHMLPRRSSEPVKQQKQFEAKSIIKAVSLDSENSPQLSPRLQHPKKLVDAAQPNPENAFKHTRVFFNPVSDKNVKSVKSLSVKKKLIPTSLHSHFEQPPELNRNNKPKHDTDADIPPTVPSRVSPSFLDRNIILEEPDEIDGLLAASKLPKIDELSNHRPSLDLLRPPPLPPKNSLLPTKSAPIDKNIAIERDNVSRSSSFSTSPTEKKKIAPPEVPAIDYDIKSEFIHLVKDQSMNKENTDISESNVISELNPVMRPKLESIGRAHTADESLVKQRINIPRKMTLDVLSNSHIQHTPPVSMPKILTEKNKSQFPKSPKKFF